LRYSAAEFPAGFALGGNKAVAALDIDHPDARRSSVIRDDPRRERLVLPARSCMKSDIKHSSRLFRVSARIRSGKNLRLADVIAVSRALDWSRSRVKDGGRFAG